MKTAGIICECNPFHEGHARLIRAARDSGARVVALMSGCFVQRGEAAILSPHARAEILLSHGVDLVLELPFPYAAAGAEFFGSAGVEILSRFGVEELWFGSECGELATLQRLAEAAESEAFAARYAAMSREKIGTAAAYVTLLGEMTGVGYEALSNDLLALSYLRAIRRQSSSMRPVTIPRVGSGYRDAELGEGIPSATALRRAWREEGMAAILPHLPEGSPAILQRETDAGCAPASLALAERAVLHTLRSMKPEEVEAIAELSGGLGARLCHAAEEAASLSELLQLSATKKYPDARLRRGILMAMTDTRPDDLRASPAYVRLLGATATGCALLAERRRTTEVPVLTRWGEVPDTPSARRQAELEVREKSLFALCMPRAMTAAKLLTHAPVMGTKKQEE